MFFFDAFGLCVRVLILVNDLLLYSCGERGFGIYERFAIAGLGYADVEG